MGFVDNLILFLTSGKVITDYVISGFFMDHSVYYMIFCLGFSRTQ